MTTTGKRKSKPFARVEELTMAPNAGRFAVLSGRGRMGAQWGVFDTIEEAQGKAERLNETTRLD